MRTFCYRKNPRHRCQAVWNNPRKKCRHWFVCEFPWMLLVPPHCSNPDFRHIHHSETLQEFSWCSTDAAAETSNWAHLNTLYPSQKWVLQNDPRHTGIFFYMREEKSNKQHCTRIKSGWCPPPILHTSFGDSRALLFAISWRVFVSQRKSLRASLRNSFLCVQMAA